MIRRLPVLGVICALTVASFAAPVNRATAAPATAQWTLVCDLTEPFWRLAITRTKVVLDTSEGAVDKPRIQSVTGTPNTTLRMTVLPATKRALSITVSDEPGGDGMSDRVYSHTVEITGSGIRYVGGCERLSDGASVYVVAGVPKGDVLNVRAEPRATAAIKITVDNGDYLWRRVGAASGMWVPVELLGRGERGPVPIVRGWVNSTYLRAL